MIDIWRSERCLICNTKMDQTYSWSSFLFNQDKNSLCPTCIGKFEALKSPRCSQCSRSIPDLAPEFIHGDICNDCFRWEESERWQGILTENISLYKYNDFLKDLIAKFKYRGDYAIAQVFANDIKTEITIRHYDFIVPIPLSDERLQERGFNQSEALIKVAGFYAEQLLTRVHSEKQSKKSRKERIELARVFECSQNKNIKDKHILLVDDIYTTGSTIRHAAETLIQAGASKIYSLTVAR